MLKTCLHGQDVIITSKKRMSTESFNRACSLLLRVNKEILKIEKDTPILIQDTSLNSIIIERLSTETFTLQLQCELKREHVFIV
ncbi:hypothetical protein ACFFIX_09480 [Metabacillus herbersteinensis]|uniref:Uncharacterized protein n=1 Tax=Metabacillus herbersteinensis TaxID=283816 RepID=A0ABV6GE73_9BACI